MVRKPVSPGMLTEADPVQVIADSPLLRSIDRSSLHGLRTELEWIDIDRNEGLSLDGGGGDALYFVASGRLKITHAPGEPDAAAASDAQVLAVVVAGDVISEMRALTGSDDLAGLWGVTAARLVRLSKERFDHYLATHPDVSDKLRNIFAPRFYHNEMIGVLRDMFGSLTDDVRADIESRLAWRYLARGNALFNHGEAPGGLFVLVSGRLQELTRNEAGEERIFTEISQGETVGEMGILTDEVQTTSVVASRNSVLLEFSRDNFHELATRYPKLNEWLARLLAIRLSGVVREGPRARVGATIVVVPANRGAPLEDFARRLSVSLSRTEACLLLSSEQTDGLLGSAGISQAVQGSPGDMRLHAWLNQQETQVRYVICIADPELTNWTSRCIRQADEIISIGVAGASPKPTEVEAEVFRQEDSGHAKFRKTLVLLHPTANSRPAGTMDWLREREVHRHFHLRAGNRDDLDRVVRYVLRREVGLVLSGGGSRGFAHAGIIRAIREAGLPIDLIAGVSIGAIMAAEYAYSDEWEQTIPRLKAQLEGVLKDYTFPFVSLVRGRRFDRYLQALFGETRIEDLPIPFFCVSSNLTRANVVVHRRGPLWRATRASGSLPGLVPPVVENGDLLYDGCLLNNLPMDLMREEIQTGVLIAVDVVPPVDLGLRATGLESPSGWRIAWSRLNPLAKPIQMPGIVSILQRAGALGSISSRQKLLEGNIADLYLRPPVEEFRILDFSVADQAAEIGYAYGTAAIASWKARSDAAAL